MASRKMLAPNTTIWWVPEGGFVNPAAPTAAEINAGTNVSCAIVTGYTLNATASDTDDSRSICDNANVKQRTFKNYESEITYFRSDLVTTTAVYVAAFNLFKKPGARGYFVRRFGKGFAAVAATGDKVSVYKFESDVPQTIESDAGGPIEITVPYIPQGEMKQNYTLAA